MATLFLEAEAFGDLGGWVIDQQSTDQMGSPYIMAHGLGRPVADASTRVAIEREGLYTVYARTRDWTSVWNAPSSAGRFCVLADGAPLENELGTNGPDWAWQCAGRVQLEKGVHALALHDLTGFNARCDALLLTTDDAPPPDGGEELEELRRRLTWKSVKEDDTLYDLVVVGGGVAGLCMAIAAKRTGCSVLLIHDREVLGGCNSSEIRVCMGGAVCLPPYEKLGSVVRQIAPVMGSPFLFGAE